MIRSLIPSCFLIDLSFAFLLVSSAVSVLFIFSLPGKTNSQPQPRSVSWVILAFRGAIVIILSTLIAISSLLMSISLRIPPPPQRVLLFRMSSIPRLTISRFPFFTYRCRDSATSGLYFPSSSSYRASC